MYNRVSLESIQPVDRQQSEDAAAELQIAIDKSIWTPPSTASTATRSDGEDVSPFADTRSLDGLPARCATLCDGANETQTESVATNCSGLQAAFKLSKNEQNDILFIEEDVLRTIPHRHHTEFHL